MPADTLCGPSFALRPDLRRCDQLKMCSQLRPPAVSCADYRVGRSPCVLNASSGQCQRDRQTRCDVAAADELSSLGVLEAEAILCPSVAAVAEPASSSSSSDLAAGAVHVASGAAQLVGTSEPLTVRSHCFIVFHHGLDILAASLRAALVAAAHGQSRGPIATRFTIIHNGNNATDEAVRATIAEARRGARADYALGGVPAAAAAAAARASTVPIEVPIEVMRNAVRHPLSGGHLSRDWNTALHFGFGSLSAPQASFVVLMQHDCTLRPSFFLGAARLHLTSEPGRRARFDFVAYGRGDELHSYTPAALQYGARGPHTTTQCLTHSPHTPGGPKGRKRSVGTVPMCMPSDG